MVETKVIRYDTQRILVSVWFWAAIDAIVNFVKLILPMFIIITINIAK